jgi:hypothetical protein
VQTRAVFLQRLQQRVPVALGLLQPDELRQPLRVCCLSAALERRAQEDDACDRETKIGVAGSMDSSSKRLGEVNRCFYVRYRRCVLYLLNDKPSQAVADQDKRPLSFLLCVSDKELAGAGLAGLTSMKTICASTYTCVLPVLEQHL